MDEMNSAPEPSPIEKQLFAAMMIQSVFKADNMLLFYKGQDRGGLRWVSAKHQFDVYAQHKIQSFYVDMFVTCFSVDDSAKKSSVVIECDGHEFHEKTKEQVERDKRRERAIVSQGFQLLRFAGSEIYRNPDVCAKEVREFLLGNLK